MKRANDPFQFVAASYLTRVRPERARTLGEMARLLRTVSDESVFCHTFQSLEAHHYTRFSSDFAQWIMAACNEHVLAESLASVDLRAMVTLTDLRQALVNRIERHLEENPLSADRPAFEPFHFCETVEAMVPLDAQAYTVPELADGISHLSLQTLHYHFINAALRLGLSTNDFSHWIKHSLGLPQLADRLNRIDFYNNTLEGARKQALRILESWKEQ